MQQEKGLLLKGDFYFDRLINGVYQGYVDFGNTVVLEVKPNSERKDRPSKRRDTHGSNLSTVFAPKPLDFKVGGDTMNIENIALAQMGTVSAGSVTGASVTDEVINLIHDKWVKVSQEYISNLVLQDNTDTTTYTLNSDYELKAGLGMIKALSTGTITDGQEIHADFDYDSRTADVMQGVTQSNITGRGLLDGINLETGETVRMYIDEAVVTPDQAIDFMGEEFGSLSLSGTMNVLDGKTAPYELHDNVVSS